MTEADLTIGTSAGSTAAAQITSGIPPTELLADILAPAAPASRQVRQIRPRAYSYRAGVGSHGQDERSHRCRSRMRPTCAAEWARRRSRRTRRRTVLCKRSGGLSSLLDCRASTGRNSRLLIPAVDAHTGEPVVFDRHSGVDLVDAVAASTSNGFGIPPYSIGGNRYINGGYRRNENADLAAGYVTGSGAVTIRWQITASARAGACSCRHRSTNCVHSGSRVETMFPDSNAEHMFGANAMDLSLRPAAARAGYDQGRSHRRPAHRVLALTPRVVSATRRDNNREC